MINLYDPCSQKVTHRQWTGINERNSSGNDRLFRPDRRTDILTGSWSGVYNPRTGKIWKNELWKALKEAYASCPEY
jgi:hypothetical protein